MAIVVVMLGVALGVTACAFVLVVSNVIVQGPGVSAQKSLAVESPLHRMLAVTPPVIFDIAENLRRHQPANRVQKIEDRAHDNMARLQGRSDACDPEFSPCPLQCEDNTCVAAPNQAHDCMSQCPLFGDQVSESSQAVPGESSSLTAALSSVGLDGSRYELNSALAVALRNPDAAQRWVRGENVFSDCRRLDA